MIEIICDGCKKFIPHIHEWLTLCLECETRFKKAVIFTKHIEEHLKTLDIDGKVCCKICEKDIDKIYLETMRKREMRGKETVETYLVKELR